jgi:hypothetical protein
MLSSVAIAVDPSLIMTAAGMPPDPWQRSVLRSRPTRLLLNCSRQAGKSSVTAAMALDEALHRPPALVLLLSPSLRQSGELFRSVMNVHEKLDVGSEPDAESSLRAELPNGSRIIALPGADESTIRGFASVSLLIIDEASRVDDALYHAARPMLAVSGGRLAALSTPWGRRGWFYDSWLDGDFERVRVTAPECPRISAEFLAQERRALPDSVFRQEYMCEFMDISGAVFRGEDIEAAFDNDLQALPRPAGLDSILRGAIQ